MNNFTTNNERDPRVIFPTQIIEKRYVGELKGYYVRNTDCYNILPLDEDATIDAKRVYNIGFILPVNPFRFVNEEIASQIRYLKTEESTPEEAVRKIQEALKDRSQPETDVEAIQEELHKQLTEGTPIKLDSSEYAVNRIMPWVDFYAEVREALNARPKGIDSAAEMKIRIEMDNRIESWMNDVFAYGLGNGWLRIVVRIEPGPQDQIVGYWEDDELHFVQLGSCRECRQEKYSLKLDVFSRNTGILESDIMLEKGAMFIGCGSVGSLFALELAKAGVGRFLLIDSDIFGYHNICRHQCGIYDVGRYKTDALKDRILQVNPYAKVVVKNTIVQDIPVADLVEFCDSNTIVIGGADNREGDLYANNFALQIGMPFMSIGCWERAFAGEIFYCLPQGMPTYRDFMEVSGLLSARVNQNRRFYTTEEDLEKALFEPGISADINFVTVVAVKMALDILNIGNENYTQRLLPHLTQYTLVCNTNNPRIGGETAEIFSYPLQVTTSIIVPYSNR
jgi:molybdopterin/thiamine biosynthesis adenylyltransferase